MWNKIKQNPKTVAVALVMATVFVHFYVHHFVGGSGVRALVEVEIRSGYEIHLDEGDTLFFSLHSELICKLPSQRYSPYTPIDTVVSSWVFDCCRDSAFTRENVKGFCVGNNGETFVRGTSMSRRIGVDSVKILLQKELAHCQLLETNYKSQVTEIDYYLRTHSPVDAGYNEVVRYKDVIAQKSKNATVALGMVKRALQENCSAVRKVYYTINGKPAMEAGTTKDLVLLRPTNFFGNLPAVSSNTLMAALSYPHDEGPLIYYDKSQRLIIATKQDSVYYGNCFGHDGSFYRGEFNDKLQCNGVGLCIDAEFVKYGKWKKNKFSGEQMLYTADRVYGIDISRYQHDLKKPYIRYKKVKVRHRWVTVKQVITATSIHWSKLRIKELGKNIQRDVQGEVDYPVSFVFIKATQSTNIWNKYYYSDLKSALKHGIPVAPYHFFSTKTSGAEQAKYFLKFAQVERITLPPMLDVEPSDNQVAAMGGAKNLFREMLTWLHVVEKASGRMPLLYVSQNFVDKYMKHAPAELLKYDVWIARYGAYRPYVKLQLWQLSPNGKVDGINGDVDINVFNGSREDFEKWVKK